jgi:hypothetical protein
MILRRPSLALACIRCAGGGQGWLCDERRRRERSRVSALGYKLDTLCRHHNAKPHLVSRRCTRPLVNSCHGSRAIHHTDQAAGEVRFRGVQTWQSGSYAATTTIRHLRSAKAARPTCLTASNARSRCSHRRARIVAAASLATGSKTLEFSTAACIAPSPPASPASEPGRVGGTPTRVLRRLTQE